MADESAGDEQFLQALPHRQLTWNTPLSGPHADRLLASLRLTAATRIVDLGCGWGNLLLRALTVAPRLSGVGVDRNPAHLERARSSARVMGLAHRAQFIQGDIVEYDGTGDRVICIGADHAWGGAEMALYRLPRRVDPGGVLLFGCGYWSRPPSPRLVELFGALPASLQQDVALAGRMGWAVHSTDSADALEWDDFEETWTRDLDDIVAREPNSPAGAKALRLAKQRREEYRGTYRGVLGFAYLVLERTDNSSTSEPTR